MKKLFMTRAMFLLASSIAVSVSVAGTTEKSWEELAASTQQRVRISVPKSEPIQFCEAQSVPTKCTLGTTPPGRGCYVLLTKNFDSWIAPKLMAARYGGVFVTGSEGPVEEPDGPGCGPVQPTDYWLYVQ